MPTHIEVPINEYEQLLSDQKFLNVLYAAGVDSWIGYEQAQEMIEEGTQD